jgi:tRNA 2-selenouridine synthase SelU
MSGSDQEESVLQRCVPGVDARSLLALHQRVVIDLRSPEEFREDQVPGSLNVPLFEDEERALIGLLYKSLSPDEAFRRGLELVRGRLAELVRKICSAAGEPVPAADPVAIFEDLTRQGMAAMEARLAMQRLPQPPANPIVLHCWRGGLRSRSVAALLQSLGLRRTVVLEGGYRAWRTVMVEHIERWQPQPVFVLRGLTGVGKTLVLRAIEAQRPGWTLDLEELAGHRSSMLGAVGLEPVSQKRFESRLAQRLSALRGPCVVMEGESRKVGDRIIPANVFLALESGTALGLETPVEERLRILYRSTCRSSPKRSIDWSRVWRCPNPSAGYRRVCGPAMWTGSRARCSNGTTTRFTTTRSAEKNTRSRSAPVTPMPQVEK